jgi:hypothetical protein
VSLEFIRFAHCHLWTSIAICLHVMAYVVRRTCTSLDIRHAWIVPTVHLQTLHPFISSSPSHVFFIGTACFFIFPALSSDKHGLELEDTGTHTLQCAVQGLCSKRHEKSIMAVVRYDIAVCQAEHQSTISRDSESQRVPTA